MKPKKNGKEKLRPLFYEMKIEAIMDAGDTFSDSKRMVRVCGTIHNSNFVPKDEKFCIPMFAANVIRRIHIDDLVKVTVFCPESSIKKTEKKVSFKSVGMRYEVWNDGSDGWDCIYEKMDADGQDT